MHKSPLNPNSPNTLVEEIAKSENGFNEFTENIIDTVREPLLAIDKDLRVIKASRSFYNFFKVTAGETIGKLIYELGNHQWDIPKLKELLEKIIPEKNSFDDYEVEHNFSTIGKRVMLLNARRVKRAFGKEQIILLAIEDITERKGKEDALKKTHSETSDSLNTLLNQMHAPIIIWDTSMIIKRFNRKFELLSGYDSAEVIGKKIDFLFPKEKIAATLELLKNHLDAEHLEVAEIAILTKDNNIKTVLWNSSRILDEEGKNIIATISQDITSRKQSELALRKSESQLRTLVKTIPDLVWLKDMNGVYLSCNPMFERFFGAKETDIIGKTDHDFVDRELSDFFRENDQKAMEAGKPTSNEEWVTFADDGYRAFLDTIKTPIYDSDGTLLGVLGIGRDLTERKKSEEALRKSEQLYRSLFENMLNGFTYCKMIFEDERPQDFIYLAVNNSFEILTGLKDVIGKKVSEVIPGIRKSDPVLFELYGRVALTGKPETIEIYVEALKMWYAMSVYSPGKEHFVSIFDVITKRKNAEKEIAMLAHSLKSISECVSITDLENKILFVNESFLKTYGYKLNELIGENISIVRSQRNKQEQLDEILPATIQGEWHGELLNRKKDGTEFPVYLSTTLIKAKENEVLGLIGVASDITERKLAEIELIKAKERAEESDRLKTAFLTNMSHEIRTPMNGILGFTELLRTADLAGEEQQKYIVHIEKSGARLLNLINDIISFSIIESQQTEVSVSKTNVNEQVEYIYHSFKLEAEQKKLHISFKNELALDKAFISTDQEKVFTVFTNLVKNAIKFTQTGSIELGYAVKGDFVEFYVKDSGSGISDEQKKFIFERFRQGSDALNRNYDGAGLGLSISKAYVEMLGGKIWVENNAGKNGYDSGSTFFFTIPVCPSVKENSYKQ